MVVPRLGCESMERLPFTSFSRSCMRLRPSPWPFLAALRLKPTP
jgi:hypothetical protein